MSKSKKIIIWGLEGREEYIDDAVFDGLKFVDKARTKTDDKRPVEYIFYDGANLVGMDAHRIHIYSVDDSGVFAAGHCYEVIKSSSSEIHLGDMGANLSDAFFPDWKETWPDKLYEQIDVQIALGAGYLSKSYGNLIKHMPINKTIEYAHFKDLAQMYNCDVGWYNDNLIFKAGKMGGLIAPIKISDGDATD